MSVVLGFDYGQKRTGVAIASGDDIKPLITLSDHNIELAIQKLIKEYQPSELVVGIPRNLEGEETHQTKLAKEFGALLALTTNIPVKFQDEALSSERALQRMGNNTSIKDRKKIIDQVSAQIILEDYLK